VPGDSYKRKLMLQTAIEESCKKSKKEKAEEASNLLQTMALAADENSLYKIWNTKSNNLLTANWADALESELSKVALLQLATPTNNENNIFNSLENLLVVLQKVLEEIQQL
ncbi:13841_t:CDS:2, partial [Cetraspora pellucida]